MKAIRTAAGTGEINIMGDKKREAGFSFAVHERPIAQSDDATRRLKIRVRQAGKVEENHAAERRA
jgi:hypothetical protein